MLGKQYLKYVSSNILGMMGLSFYILADTYLWRQGWGQMVWRR